MTSLEELFGIAGRNLKIFSLLDQPVTGVILKDLQQILLDAILTAGGHFHAEHIVIPQVEGKLRIVPDKAGDVLILHPALQPSPEKPGHHQEKSQAEAQGQQDDEQHGGYQEQAEKQHRQRSQPEDEQHTVNARFYVYPPKKKSDILYLVTDNPRTIVYNYFYTS